MKPNIPELLPIDISTIEYCLKNTLNHIIPQYNNRVKQRGNRFKGYGQDSKQEKASIEEARKLQQIIQNINKLLPIFTGVDEVEYIFNEWI